MHEESIQDDILFDRLVDGDLSAGERRRLLESLDTRPEGWRRCALALLEAQSWREDLGQLMREPVQAQSIDVDAKSIPSTVADDRPATKQGITWLAIAAGLTIALTFGLMHRNNGVHVVHQPVKPSGEAVAVAPPTALRTQDETRVDDALTLWVRDDKGQPRSLRVPLVDAGTLDRQLGVEFRSGLPADVRAQLQDRGYNVQSKRRYAPLWLDNGRPLILPVEDTKIMPVSQEVY